MFLRIGCELLPNCTASQSRRTLHSHLCENFKFSDTIVLPFLSRDETLGFARYDILIAASSISTIIWCVTPCSLVEVSEELSASIISV
jgi:hypothetical protein